MAVSHSAVCVVFSSSDPSPGQVNLVILQNANQETGTTDQTVTFNVGKWSDASPATLEEAAAALRRSLDDPGDGMSNKVGRMQPQWCHCNLSDLVQI